MRDDVHWTLQQSFDCVQYIPGIVFHQSILQLWEEKVELWMVLVKSMFALESKAKEPAWGKAKESSAGDMINLCKFDSHLNQLLNITGSLIN